MPTATSRVLLSAVEQRRQFATRGRCSLPGKELAGPIKFEAARDPVPLYTLWKKRFFFDLCRKANPDSSVALPIGTVPTKLPVFIAVLDCIKILGYEMTCETNLM